MSKRRRKSRLPEPPERVRIESLAHDGRGVTHIEGKTVFIDAALPEEEISFEYLATHRRFDEGRATGIHQASRHRVEPPCPHFGICGGCSLQHMDGAAQIEAKQQVLLENLGHIGKVSPGAVLPPLTGPLAGYRTKARLGVRYVAAKGRTLVGFREKRSSFVADLSRCLVLHPTVGEQLGPLSALVDRLQARARIPQIEVAVAEPVTALVFRHLDPLDEADIAQLREFGIERNIHIYLQPAGPESVHLLWPEHSILAYRLPAHEVELQFHPSNFTQINPSINRLMVDRVLDLLALRENDRVLDLYCGLGNFTLPMARHAASVLGVEGDAELVARARDNAARNKLGNVEFHTADLSLDPQQEPWTRESCGKVLLDPPRSGAAAVLDLLGASAAQRIVYVSCHPGSLARDAGVLVNAHGYELTAAGVMDMFPHTAHVESIALFEAG